MNKESKAKQPEPVLTLEQRKEQFLKLTTKNPNHLPIRIRNAPDGPLPEGFPSKFLIPKDFTGGQLLSEIRNRIKLEPEAALFLMIDKGKNRDKITEAVLLSNVELVSQIVKQWAQEDGFLYLIASQENVFG